MNNTNLIIYKLSSLYHILEELKHELNFNIIEVSSEKVLFNKIKLLKKYLIITNKELPNINNQIFISSLPINIFKLVEKINIEILKYQFNDQSQIYINDYYINLNSRELFLKNVKLKLTEKEISTIIYLFKANKAISVSELQKNVWRYQSDIETHTVETHIYRLRKKIAQTFNENDFIISKKNGYQIK